MNLRTMCRFSVVCLIVTALAGAAFAQQQDPWQRQVTLNVTDSPARNVLDSLFRGSGINYAIDPAVTAVIHSLSIKDVPMQEALRTVCRSADLVYRVDNGVVMISTKPPAGNWSKTVNIEFKQTGLMDAISVLLSDTGISYMINPQLNNLKVTAVLRDVTLDRALQEIAKAAGADYRTDGGIVSFTPGRSGNVPGMLSQGPGAQHPQPGVPNDATTEVILIQLRYLEPGEVAPLVSGPGVQVQTVTGGKLILRGPAAQLQKAKELVAALDTETALPRMIQVKVTVKETGAAEARVNVLSVGCVEGQNCHAEVNSGVPVDANKLGVTSFSADLLPTINEDGKICVTGNVSFRWGVSDSGTGHVDYVDAQRISTSRCLEPGKSEVIGGLTRTDSEGWESSLEISAVAVIVPGRAPALKPTPGFGGYGGYGYGGGYGSLGGGSFGGGSSGPLPAGPQPMQPKSEAKPAEPARQPAPAGELRSW